MKLLGSTVDQMTNRQHNQYYNTTYPLWLLGLLLLVLLAIAKSSTESRAESLNDRNTDAKTRYKTLYNQQPFLDLHTGPSKGYPIFHIIERGEAFQVIKQHTDWYQIRTTSGIEGWLTKTSIAKAETEEQQAFLPNISTESDFRSRIWEGGILHGDLGGASVLSGYGSYHMTRNISAEGSFAQSIGNASNSYLLLAGLYQQPFPEWRYSPFFGLGLGMINTDPNTTLINSNDRVNDLMHATIGLRRYFSRRFLFRAEYNHYVVFTNDDNNQELYGWKLGLSTFLN